MLKRLVMLVCIIGVVAAFSPAANGQCPNVYYKQVKGIWHFCCPYTAYISGRAVNCEDCYAFSWGSLNYDYFGKGNSQCLLGQDDDPTECMFAIIAAFGTSNELGQECENRFTENCYFKVLRIQIPPGLKGKKLLDTKGQPGFTPGLKVVGERLEDNDECTKRNCQLDGTIPFLFDCGPNPNWECYEIPMEFDGAGCSCRFGYHNINEGTDRPPYYECCVDWDYETNMCATYGEATLVALNCEDYANLDPGVYVIGDTGLYNCNPIGEGGLDIDVPEGLCEDLFNKYFSEPQQ